MKRPRVAVFDADLPPGLAFVRSLSRAGVAVTVYSDDPMAMSRYSRYAVGAQHCPSVYSTDRFTDWLADCVARGEIDLVAPTSDYVAFCASRAGIESAVDTGQTEHDRLLDCLFKARFNEAFTSAGFPVLPTELPTSADEAAGAARHLGFPLVAKPRSHVGVGLARGFVARSADTIVNEFRPYVIPDGQRRALEVDPDLAWPMLQAYVDPSEIDVISVTGLLSREGEVLAVDHSRKTHQWPPRLGVGTQFEALDQQPFTEHAVATIRRVLGHGIFELEVLVDRRSGEYWAIDLNPRGFGQMALTIARGHDLPALWYQSVTDTTIPRVRVPNRAPRFWRAGIPYTVESVIRLARGPLRKQIVREAVSTFRDGRVGPVFDWRDPVPGLLWAWRWLKHPGGLVRPFMSDAESK